MRNINGFKKLYLLNLLLVSSFIIVLASFIFTPKEYVLEVLFLLFIVVYSFFKYALVKTSAYLKELEHTIDSFDKYVIFSKSDLYGKITYANKAFCKISGYSKEELIGKPHSVVRHPDMDSKIFEQMWEELDTNRYWRGEIKNKKKDDFLKIRDEFAD